MTSAVPAHQVAIMEMGPSFQVMVIESWTSEKKSECVWECDSQREEERQALWLIQKIPQSKEYESKP